MKTFLSILIAFVSLSLIAEDSDARRFGGARSIGKQRDMTQQQAAPKAPAQQQSQAAPATPAQQPAGASKWLGPLAGLALGAGLAALFLNNGLAGVLAGLLLIAAVVAAAVFLARALRAKAGAPEPLRYATSAGATGPAIPSLPGGAGAGSVAAITASAVRWPAGFDMAEFVRHAKLNFVRMQEAHDRRDLATMRDFLTPELCAEIESEIESAGPAPQKTEVVTLEAEVLDVAAEGDSYVVSVRFSGLIREEIGGEARPFSEIWHLEKPQRGRSGWLVSGIQQS
jgi:predicted lipid-binding transport protein (Tim44 family)